ncbi:hypothetical protein VTO73DRAFT_12930 [Trametes versicolor]
MRHQSDHGCHIRPATAFVAPGALLDDCVGGAASRRMPCSPGRRGGTARLVPTSNSVVRRCPCTTEPAVDEGAALRGPKATGTVRLLVRSEAAESALRASQCADRSIRLVEYRRGVFVHRWDLRVCAHGVPPSMACAERSTFSDGVDSANWRPGHASLCVAARERREASVLGCWGAGVQGILGSSERASRAPGETPEANAARMCRPDSTAQHDAYANGSQMSDYVHDARP